MNTMQIDKTLAIMRNKFIEIIKKSEYVLGAWNFGSETYGLSDAYSDVDIILLIDGNNFNQFADLLDGYMKQISEEILLCWPENFNCGKIINNGYLLMKEEQVYQFDVVLLNSEKTDYYMCRLFYTDLKEENVYFDKKGFVKGMIELGLKESRWNADIEHLEKTYWFFANMTIKYLKREDYFKLNATLHTMMETHISMLLTGFDAINWGGSENKLHFIPFEKQKHLKKYACSENYTKMKRNLLNCMKEFQIDAKEVYSLKHMPYSTNLGDIVMDNWLKKVFD